jgi:hypothetical protein
MSFPAFEGTPTYPDLPGIRPYLYGMWINNGAYWYLAPSMSRAEQKAWEAQWDADHPDASWPSSGHTALLFWENKQDLLPPDPVGWDHSVQLLPFEADRILETYGEAEPGSPEPFWTNARNPLRPSLFNDRANLHCYLREDGVLWFRTRDQTLAGMSPAPELLAHLKEKPGLLIHPEDFRKMTDAIRGRRQEEGKHFIAPLIGAKHYEPVEPDVQSL